MSSISPTTILVACLCLAYAAPFPDTVQTPETFATDVNYRLPLNIKPINYRIHLQPYLNESHPKAFKFDGECYIEIQAAEKIKEIQLHMKNLEISVSEYFRKDLANTRIQLPKVSPHNLTDIVVYNLKEELQANMPYILHFVYMGSMDDDMEGFYRSQYKTPQNVTKWLGSTQFESHNARRAFPSFDEPKFKATFDLSLTRHRSLRTTGPTRLISIKPEGDYITDVYATTPKMSSYILAFMVSEFNERYDGEFGVLARPEYYDQTEYSFDVGKKILKSLSLYFDIDYYKMGNDKMHMAAIPDFAAGAMENWGLLTYREKALLFDKEHSTLNSQQYIASVVAHEQAHMWFGDLVTCDWWSYTWLNEGFARYFQYFGTHMVESRFKLDQQFTVEQIHKVMEMDSTNATNPMSDEDTHTPSDADRMFNSISYNKGATFVRMTKSILGELNFQKSLTEYLNTYKYTNTIPSDLFTVWKKYWPAIYEDYADIYFKDFTTQVGYPVVTFNRTNETTVLVSQKRFLLKDFDTANTGLTYTVPITYTTSNERNFYNVFPRFFLGTTPTAFGLEKNVSWIIGNIQETGYYRVNYDQETWNKIYHHLFLEKWDDIHEVNRAQIVDDVLNLARSGEIDYDLAFFVLGYLETETNYLPWTAAFNGFNYLAIRLGNDTQDFAQYIQYITNKAYIMLGFEAKKYDTSLDIYNRGKILSWSCKFGNADCISKAKEYFNKNLIAEPVPVDIRSAVYCTVMREGNEQDFNKLYNKFKTGTVATEETLLLSSLGCVKDRKLVNRFFNMVVSDEVRRQDKSGALSSLYSENNENVEPVFDLVVENFEALAKSMGDYSDVSAVISNIAARFTTQDQLEKLKFFNDNNKDKFGKSLERSIKTVEFNLGWSKTHLGAVKANLQKYRTNGSVINSVSVLYLVLVALITMIFH